MVFSDFHFVLGRSRTVCALSSKLRMIRSCLAVTGDGTLGLLDLTCAKVASMIKGKNTEEIRALAS